MLAKEKAIEILQELWKYKEIDKYTEAEIRQTLEMASNALEQESKIGHWIRFKKFENGYYHIKCSKCGQYWSIDGHAKTFKYCFNCGTKMEGDVE